MSSRQLVATVVHALLLLALSWQTPQLAVAGGVNEGKEIAAMVKSADLVVVGRVQDVIDDSPGASQRRSREAHRVVVKETLQGPDITGWRLALRPPEDYLWSLETSYVLFLEQQAVGSERPRVLEGSTLPATPEAVARVRREIAQAGGTVLGRPVFWLSVVPGWSIRPSLQVLVFEDGEFRWQVRDGSDSVTEQTGKLTPESTSRLVARAKSLERGSVTDDADIISVGWVENEQVHRKTVYGGDRQSIEHFLDAVMERLRQASP